MMTMTNDDLIGYWKITKMDVWGQAYVDLVVPGFIEFEMEDVHLMGQFQFGTVVGWLDCRLSDIGGARNRPFHRLDRRESRKLPAASDTVLPEHVVVPPLPFLPSMVIVTPASGASSASETTVRPSNDVVAVAMFS